MALLATIIAEIKTNAIAAVSLPTPPTGVQNWYTSIGAISQEFTQNIEKGKTSFPCVILSIGDFMADTDYGIGDVLTKRMPVTLYYIAQKAGTNGNQDSVSSEVANIMIAFDDPSVPFNSFFVIEPGSIISNVDGSITSAVQKTAKNQVVAASVSWSPGFQVNIATS